MKMTEAKARAQLAKAPDYPACTCVTCQQMCEHPCWPTPEEAERLLDAGYAPKMMRDYWAEDRNLPYTELICPAERGNEGTHASFFTFSGCVLQVNGLCTLHDLGLKPTEGRKAGCKGGRIVHLQVAATWNSPKGRAVVERWKKMVGYGDF